MHSPEVLIKFCIRQQHCNDTDHLDLQVILNSVQNKQQLANVCYLLNHFSSPSLNHLLNDLKYSLEDLGVERGGEDVEDSGKHLVC